MYKGDKVRAKKHLGQHFLKDETIAQKIVDSLEFTSHYKQVLEVGPGMGVLTKYLIENKNYDTAVIEIDAESIVYLEKNYPQLAGKIINGDFLRYKLTDLFKEPFAVIGNFPYNISSQILFKVLDFRDHVPEVVGMFQREVAMRIASPPGNKTYGILSVLLQAYYDIEYLFTVSELVFDPPPKVKSGVLRLKRNNVTKIDCDEVLFKQIVKAGFNQRRKTLRNSLKTITSSRAGNTIDLTHFYFDKRAEQLSVNDFITLTRMISNAS